MRAMERRWGWSAVRGSLAAAVIVCGLGVWQPAADAATSCPGRPQLSCALRTALYDDSVDWAIDGFEAVDLFQARGTLHLNNPALSQFWRFEAATGITRYMYELAVGSQGNDLSFETVPQLTPLRAPMIRPSGLVDGRLARMLSRLLGAENMEIANLLAMDVALNRATGAAISSRQDWASYQTYLAARFARKAAAAISGLVSRQRAVTKAFVHKGLHFGVGAADQRAAQRAVRRHGWPRQIAQNMEALGLGSSTIALAKRAFLHGTVGTTTFSLAGYLSSANVIRAEKSCVRALLQFSEQTPAVPVPS